MENDHLQYAFATNSILVCLPQVFSQHPYAEQYIGRPHVMTVDYNNSLEFDAAIQEIMRTKVRHIPMHIFSLRRCGHEHFNQFSARDTFHNFFVFVIVRLE